MAMNDALLDMAEDAGLISHADRKQWQDNDWYIPFYREDDDGDVMGPWKQKGLAGQRAMIKKLKGVNKTPMICWRIFWSMRANSSIAP